jgi:hypothetical protein
MPTKKLWPLAALLFTACSQAETLSNNLNDTTYYTELVGGSSYITAGFQTGDSGYVLNSVTALMQEDTPGDLTLSLYSNAMQASPNNLGFQPGTLLGTLTSSGAVPATLGDATFGGNNLKLAADATYWLVMSAPGSGSYEWAYAADNSGTGAGFYPSWGESTDSGKSWYTDDLQPMQMSVNADAVTSTPEPGVSSMVLVGLALCGVGRFTFRRR